LNNRKYSESIFAKMNKMLIYTQLSHIENLQKNFTLIPFTCQEQSKSASKEESNRNKIQGSNLSSRIRKTTILPATICLWYQQDYDNLFTLTPYIYKKFSDWKISLLNPSKNFKIFLTIRKLLRFWRVTSCKLAFVSRYVEKH